MEKFDKIVWPVWLNQEYVGWWMYQHILPREQAAEKFRKQCAGEMRWKAEELAKLSRLLNDNFPNMLHSFAAYVGKNVSNQTVTEEKQPSSHARLSSYSPLKKLA
jgi:hypothetical protein